jgi:hypothetical protein
MTPAQEVSRGAQAAELLEHPLLAEAISAVERNIIEQWTNTTPRDAADRERYYLMLLASRAFQQHLTTHIETGKLASASLKPIDRLRRVERIWHVRYSTAHAR